MSTAPPESAVRGFGGDPAELTLLPGGEGRTWRAGSIVLKPDGEETYIDWLAGLVASIHPNSKFRVATPIRSSDGTFVVDGWWASTWLEGEHRTDAWDAISAVADDFHAAIAAAGVAAPDFLRSGTSPWAAGDRVAWGEETPHPSWPTGVHDTIDRLGSQLAKSWSGAPPQPIHVDIGGNVLFAEGVAPAVIDLSMYLRPAPFANAVLAADAVAWAGAPLTLAISFLARQPEGDQLLARAIAFRVATAAVAWAAFPERVAAEVAAYAPMITLIRG